MPIKFTIIWLQKKVIVRNRNAVVRNSIRITVGKPEENRKLLEELKKIIVKYEESIIHRS